MGLHDLEAHALRLPRHERAELARHLLASLDDDAEIEREWAAEAERRYDALRVGTVQATPAGEAFGHARVALR